MKNLDASSRDSLVATEILSEAQRLTRAHSTGQPISVGQVQRIPLADLQDSFLEYDKDFMTDELLQRIKDVIRRREIKLMYPEGSKLVLGAFPSNHNGAIYTPEEIKEGKHLVLFSIDTETGLSSGFTPGLNTFAGMLPKQIHEQCTFEPKYNSGDFPVASKKDYESFIKQYEKAYKELRRLLKGE